MRTTTTTTRQAPSRPWELSSAAMAMLEKFPPRYAATWPRTGQDRAVVEQRLAQSPFRVDGRLQYQRNASLAVVLDWLELYAGSTWQQRWQASGAGRDGSRDWRNQMLGELDAAGVRIRQQSRAQSNAGTGLAQLIVGDYIRPSLGWLMQTSAPSKLVNEMGRVRDPHGIAEVRAASMKCTMACHTVPSAIERLALIMAVKGGMVRDITVGDCVEAMRISRETFGGPTRSNRHSPFFYELLHSIGSFPPGAPPTVRMFSPRYAGQVPVEQLVDRYQLTCQPIRDLLVDYLRERQPGVDYTTLSGLATTLALWFWKDLERHHPGIDSLRLSPETAAAWKQRIRTRVVRSRDESGQIIETTVERRGAAEVLTLVRAFYLDLAQWALDDPARWAQWAVACPIRATDIQHGKARSARKARTDQRTRDRLPVLPVLAQATDLERKASVERLALATKARPGESFTVNGVTFRRAQMKRSSPRVWAEDPTTGKRRDLTREEDDTFWAWAAVEVLRGTGIRIEELTELSHHSLVQYRLPSTGELILLLQVVPSKTDEERLFVISPELADVLSAIICRVRNADGSVPLVVAYDYHEKVWKSPMPILFQRTIGLETRPIPINGIRDLLYKALQRARITDATGQPLVFTPHDFRRIFTTDVIASGMPPHIAQLLLGHKVINTTMGYNTVYPEQVINGHRAFLARRRALRPSVEYRRPTDAEWDEFLGHFERRRLALGDCGRAYGTPYIHEHSCVRCPLLRVDPGQRQRLVDIRDNLIARITEAEREGWTGEAEGLRVSLATAKEKLAHTDNTIQRRNTAVNLGIPSFPQVAGLTIIPTPSQPA